MRYRWCSSAIGVSLVRRGAHVESGPARRRLDDGRRGVARSAARVPRARRTHRRRRSARTRRRMARGARGRAPRRRSSARSAPRWCSWSCSSAARCSSPRPRCGPWRRTPAASSPRSRMPVGRWTKSGLSNITTLSSDRAEEPAADRAPTAGPAATLYDFAQDDDDSAIDVPGEPDEAVARAQAEGVGRQPARCGVARRRPGRRVDPAADDVPRPAGRADHRPQGGRGPRAHAPGVARLARRRDHARRDDRRPDRDPLRTRARSSA